MINKHCILLFVFCWQVSIVFSQSFSVLTIPDSLLEHADAVVRNSTTEIDVKSKNSAVYKLDATVSILSKKGEKNAFVQLSYSKMMKIKSFKGEVYDKFGKLVYQIGKNEAKDYSAADYSEITDTRIKSWSLNKSVLPYTIRYVYELELDGLFVLPDWQPLDFGESGQNLKLVLSDQNDLIKCKTTALRNPLSENNKKTWVIDGIRALPQLNELELNDVELPEVKLSAKVYEWYGITGNSNTWSEIGNFYHSLNNERVQVDLTIKNEVQKIIGNEIDKSTIVKKIYSHLQKNYRYVSIQLGLSGWQSEFASLTFQKKYGDCKALTSLMRAMLSAANVKSYEVLINTNISARSFDYNFVKQNFNHVILVVPLENDTCWLECTSDLNPAGYLGSFTESRTGLLISETNSRLISTPTYNETNNKIGVKTSLNATDIKAQNEVVSYISSKGELQDDLRYALSRLPKNEALLFISKFEYLKGVSNIQRIDNTVIDSFKPITSFSISHIPPNLMKSQGSRIFLQPSLFDPIGNLIDIYSDYKFNSSIRTGFEFTDTLDILLPQNIEPETNLMTKQFLVESDFGVFKSEVYFDQRNNNLQIIKKFILKEQKVKQPDLASFKIFLEDAKKKLSYSLVFKTM